MANTKRCPFCGGESRLRVDNMMIHRESQKCAWVYCKRCNARTGYYLKRDDPEHFIDHALDAWDCRSGVM